MGIVTSGNKYMYPQINNFCQSLSKVAGPSIHTRREAIVISNYCCTKAFALNVENHRTRCGVTSGLSKMNFLNLHI